MWERERETVPERERERRGVERREEKSRAETNDPNIILYGQALYP